MKKLAYLYEIPLFYLLLQAFNFFFVPDAPGFYGLAPHPYWLGILLFSHRYGMVAGAFTGIVSAAFFFGANWLLGERYLFEDVTFYLEPGMFLIVGTVVGYGAQRYRDEIAGLKNDKIAGKSQESRLMEEIGVLKSVISELEKRIVTRMSTIVTLYEGARRLESVSSEELYPAILTFAAKVLEVDEAAVYVRSGGKFVLKESFGWSADTRWPREFSPDEGIAGRCVSLGKIVTVRDLMGDNTFSKTAASGEPLMVGPLKAGESGDIVGVLCIQKMPFLAFNSAAINLFSFLLSWAQRSLTRAIYVQDIKAQEILDTEFGLYSWRYLKLRLEQEFAHSKIYYLPLSVAFARVVGLDSLPEERQRTLLMAAGRLLRDVCRKMDVVATCGEPDVSFAVLFLTTSRAQAEGLRTRVVEGFAALGFPPSISLKMGLASFTPTTPDEHALLEDAKRDLFSV